MVLTLMRADIEWLRALDGDGPERYVAARRTPVCSTPLAAPPRRHLRQTLVTARSWHERGPDSCTAGRWSRRVPGATRATAGPGARFPDGRGRQLPRRDPPSGESGRDRRRAGRFGAGGW